LNFYLPWILAYSAFIVGLGFYLSRRVTQASDFLVAGRSLGPGLLFSTFLAANIGAGSSVGAAALGYELGWSACWWVGSAALGCFVLANTVGPRIWRLARARDFHTLGDFLEERYSPAVRGLVALILWFATLCLLSAQLIALSMIVHVVADVPRWVGTVLGGMVMITYFSAGGLASSARINMLQLIVLLLGFVLMVPFALHSSGGWDQVVANLDADLIRSTGPGYFSMVGIGMAGVFYYIALLAPSFVVSPGLIQKIYGARSEHAARLGVNLNALAMLLFAALPACLGIIAASQFPDLEDSQFAMFSLITERTPSWLGVIGLAAIFSAEVSTCDAVLFMLSTSLTVDLYKGFLKPKASQQSLLTVGRATAMGAGTIGILLAIRIPSIITSLTIFYSLVSVALFVPVVVGLYSKRPDSVSALAAIGVSVPTTLLLHYQVGNQVLGILNPFVIGIGISYLVMWTVTWVRGTKPQR